MGGEYLSSPPTLTSGQMNPPQLDVNGNMKVSQVNSAVGATGSAVPGSASLICGRAQNDEPTPASNGKLTALALDLTGKTITSPYANKENMLRGANSTAGTGATTFTGMGAQGSGHQNLRNGRSV